MGCPLFPVRGGCVACGGVLTGRQRRWCSEACVNAYGRNHWWANARWEALRRAAPGRDLNLARCDNCDKRVGTNCEVNHVDPRVGAGYGPGCHNHQTNLQVLCHPCHVAETTRQRHERMRERPAVRPRRRDATPESLWTFV